MSFYDDDDDDHYGDPDRQNPLRKVVKDLEKKLASAEKRATDAEDKLTSTTKVVRQRTVADVLKDKGANPALSRFVLADVDDPTAESVEKWLAENGELFGYKPAAPDGNPAQSLGLPAGTELPPDLVAAYERFQASQQGGAPTAATGEAALAAKLADPNLTRAELEALIASS